jgi:HSP20 family protein
MSLIRWDPFAEMQSLFAPLMPRSVGLLSRLSGDGDMTLEWSPSADISETEKEYLIRAELPGVRKEDVKVNLADGMITIEGERKQEKDEKGEKFHRVERFYGSFSRRFSLPDHIKAEAVRSEYRDGVLSVHIPKTDKEKAKQIPVQ